MENKLNKWFDAAKHNQPVIPAEEVGAMISNPPAVTIGAKGTKGRFSTFQKSIFMGTLLLIITSWFFWMNDTTQGETDNLTEIANEEAIIDTPKASDEVTDFPKQLVVVPNVGIKNGHKEPVVGYIGEPWNEDVMRIHVPLENYPLPNANGFEGRNRDISEYIQLTSEELTRLGIISDGKSFSFWSKYKEGDSTVMVIEEMEMNKQQVLTYNVKLAMSKNTDYEVWPIPAIVEGDHNWYWLTDDEDKIEYGYTKKFYENVKHLLVPVAIKTDVTINKKRQVHNYVFWYRPTEGFLKLLPASIVQNIKEKYAGYTDAAYAEEVAIIKQEAKANEALASFNSFELSQIKDRAITLQINEFKKLGFHKLDKKLNYVNYYKEQNGTVKMVVINEVDNELYFTGSFASLKKYKLWINKHVHPLFITDSALISIKSYFFQTTTDKRYDDAIKEKVKFKGMQDTLVPIRFVLSDNKTVYYIWFAKTEAFLKLLNPTTVSALNETYIGDKIPLGNYPVPSINNFNYGKADGSTAIQLNNEELAALGIITDGNTLSYLNQFDTTVYHFDNNSKPTVFAFSITVTKSGDLRSNNIHELDEELKKRSNSAVPVMISMSQLSDDDDRFLIAKQYIPEGYTTEFTTQMQNDLVPVKVYTKGNALAYQHDNELTFWYKNNDMFRQKLPDWARFKVQQHYPPFNEEKYKQFIDDLDEKSKEVYKQNQATAEEIKASETKIIKLTPQELRELNIRFNGKKLKYQIMSRTLDSSYVIIDLLVTPDIFSLNTRGKTGKPIHYKWNKNFAWYITDTSLAILQNFVDPLGTAEENDQRSKNMERKFKERLQKMIAVRVQFDDKAVKKAKYKHPKTDLLFWFPQTEELRKVLNKMMLDKNKAGITLKGIHILQLTDSSLNKFGVKRGKAEIEYPMSDNIQSVLSNNGSSTTFSSLTKEEFYQLPAEERGDSTKIILNNETLQEYYLYTKKNLTPHIIPYLVSDESGKHWYMNSLEEDVVRLDSSDYTFMRTNHISLNDYPKYKEQKQKNTAAIIAKMSYLIPVKVFSKDKSFVVILWYEPKPEVLALLPKAVNNEYESILTGNVPASCVYFEACQNNKGTISKCMLYPNPMADAFQVDIELGEDRKISICLTDIFGKKIKDIVTNEAQGKGLHSYETQLNNLSEGMYLVHITSDKGEQIVQRLLKKE